MLWSLTGLGTHFTGCWGADFRVQDFLTVKLLEESQVGYPR